MFRDFVWTRAARRVAPVAVLAAVVLATGAGASGTSSAWNFERDGFPDHPAIRAMKNRVQLYGGDATFTIARILKMEKLRGKPLNAHEEGKPAPSGLRTVSDKPNRSAHNFAIRDFPNVHEDEPTVAANPHSDELLVAGSHFIADGNRCIAHYSSDGGKTWSPRPIFMPQLTHRSNCSDPVLAWAPNGSRVYYAYMDIKFEVTFTDSTLTLTEDFDIVQSYSDDDGRTWTGPIIALNGDPSSFSIDFSTNPPTITTEPGFDYDKPWISTHVTGGGGNSDWVYVTATKFENNFSETVPDECEIHFTRSSDKGKTWSPPTMLDTSAGACGDPIVVQGSRPSGGPGGGVLAAWYNSTPDGWLEGGFQIRTRYSSNHGTGFGPITVASADATELPFFLGPAGGTPPFVFNKYHRWWGSMFPDVEIAPDGSAHIAYTHDPDPSEVCFVPFPDDPSFTICASATPEDGDIRYLRSSSPPYGAWTAPVTVNDDASGMAQGWATLEAGTQDVQTVGHAMWEDHRNSPAASPNFHYDVFKARRLGAGAWSANKKVTDEPSPSDFIFLGDYFDMALVNELGESPSVYGVWTDRRDEVDEFDFDDDVWGARLAPG